MARNYTAPQPPVPRTPASSSWATPTPTPGPGRPRILPPTATPRQLEPGRPHPTATPVPTRLYLPTPTAQPIRQVQGPPQMGWSLPPGSSGPAPAASPGYAGGYPMQRSTMPNGAVVFANPYPERTYRNGAWAQLPPPAGTDPNSPDEFYIPLYAQNLGAQPAAAAAAAGAAPRPAASGGGGGGYNVPYGVDPRWYAAFVDEHNGRTPEQVYRRDGEYAIDHALADKAWGEQYFRTYGRPPSEYDWKASYYDRQRAYYG